MAIARVGAANAAAATLSSPAGNLADVVVWIGYRDTAATIPTLPSGLAKILSGSGSTNAYLLAYEFCTTTSAISRTMTGATRMVAVRYSGVVGLGNSAAGAIAATSPANFAAASLLQTGTTSWWFGFGGHRTSTVGTPTGLTAIGSGSTGTGPSLSTYDTNAATNSNWPSTNVTVTASGHCTGVVELLGGVSTLSPYDFVNATFSNGNKTWTSTTNPATGNGVRGFIPRATGKYGFKFTITAYGSTFPLAVGLCTQASSMSGAPGFTDNLAIAFYTESGGAINGWINHSNTHNSSTYSHVPATTVAGYVMFDLSAGLAWVKYPALTNGWNDSGTANPDTGVGGFAYTDIVGQFLIPFSGSGDLNSIIIVDQDDISGAGVTTFQAWDTQASLTAALVASAMAQMFGKGVPAAAVNISGLGGLQARLRAGAGFNVALLARAVANSNARSAPSWAAILKARATSVGNATVIFTGAVAIAARSAVTAAASLSAQQALALLARASAAAKASVAFSGTAGLAGRASAQGAATAAGGFAAQLLARASSNSRAAAGFSGALALAARAAAKASGVLSANAVAALVARGIAMSKSVAAFSGKVALAGRAAGTTRGAIAFSGSVALVGRALAQTAGRLSANAVANLVARVSAISQAAVTFKGTVALAGRTAMLSRGVLSANAVAVLVARAAAMSRASIVFSGKVALTARGVSQTNGRSASSFALALASRVRISARAAGAASFGLALTARSGIQARVRAGGTLLAFLSGRVTAIFAKLVTNLHPPTVQERWLVMSAPRLRVLVSQERERILVSDERRRVNESLQRARVLLSRPSGRIVD